MTKLDLAHLTEVAEAHPSSGARNRTNVTFRKMQDAVILFDETFGVATVLSLLSRLREAEEALRYIAEPFDDFPAPQHKHLGDHAWQSMAEEQRNRAASYFNT